MCSLKSKDVEGQHGGNCRQHIAPGPPRKASAPSLRSEPMLPLPAHRPSPAGSMAPSWCTSRESIHGRTARPAPIRSGRPLPRRARARRRRNGHRLSGRGPPARPPRGLKVLRPELAAVIGADRFLAEIKLTANLQHPHILPLFDSGEADGYLFYVMPFIEGESLRDRLTREKQLPIADAIRIADRGRLRARLRPPPRRGPPRHQAGEYPAARRPGAGRRLRHRPRGQQGRRRPDDRDRHVARHAALHESRAGDGRARDHRRAPTSTRSAPCSTRCSPVTRRSPDRPRRRSSLEW